MVPAQPMWSSSPGRTKRPMLSRSVGPDSAAGAPLGEVDGDPVAGDESAPPTVVGEIEEPEPGLHQAVRGVRTGQQALAALVERQHDQSRRGVVPPGFATRQRLRELGHAVHGRPDDVAVEAVDLLLVVRRQGHALHPAPCSDDAPRVELTVPDPELPGALDDHHVLAPHAAEEDRPVAVLEDLLGELGEVHLHALRLGLRPLLDRRDLVRRRRPVRHPGPEGRQLADLRDQQRLVGQGEHLAGSTPVLGVGEERLDRARPPGGRPQPEVGVVAVRLGERPAGRVLEVAGLPGAVAHGVVEERALAARPARRDDRVSGVPEPLEPRVDVRHAVDVHVRHVLDREAC